MTNLLGTTEEEMDDLDSANERIESTQRALDQAAERATGTDAAIMRATSAYMAVIREATETFTKEAVALQNAEVLDTSDLHDRGQIEERRQIVARFITANGQLTETMKSGEQLFATELDKQSLTGALRADVLTGFKTGFGRTLPLTLKVRNADADIALSMLQVLALLETQWDRWRYDADAGVLEFDEDAAAEKYTELLTGIEATAEIQAVAQRELFEVQRALQSGARQAGQ